jgi:hypothetical protein
VDNFITQLSWGDADMKKKIYIFGMASMETKTKYNTGCIKNCTHLDLSLFLSLKPNPSKVSVLFLYARIVQLPEMSTFLFLQQNLTKILRKWLREP